MKYGIPSVKKHRSYIVLDIETTGLSKFRNEILEIAMIKVMDGKPVETFHAYVKPDGPIPRFITNLTGISHMHVQDAEPFDSVWPYVLDFIGPLPVLGWNVGFDLGFLAEKSRTDLSLPYMDVLWVARPLWPGLDSYKLSAVAGFLGVRKGTHRALDDCIACMDIYEAAVKKSGTGPLPCKFNSK